MFVTTITTVDLSLQAHQKRSRLPSTFCGSLPSLGLNCVNGYGLSSPTAHVDLGYHSAGPSGRPRDAARSGVLLRHVHVGFCQSVLIEGFEAA